MKKFYFALAVLGTVAMVSCVKEIEDTNNPLAPTGKNAIAFSINKGAVTRSGEEVAAVTSGVTIPLGKVKDGPSFCMEETVTDLDATAPVTRGTPAYTENVGVLYTDMGVYSAIGGDVTFESTGKTSSEGGWLYFHSYDSDPWPSDGSAAGYYLRMPATMTNVTLGNDAYATSGKIKFSYTSPDSAKDQQDILFAYTTMDKDTYFTQKYNTTGVPVYFNHALTGVKFAIGNSEDELDNGVVSITEIKFTGLVTSGSCVMSPQPKGSGPVSADAAVWTLSSTTKELTSDTYSETLVDFEKGGSFANNGDYPDSFASDSNTNNLNDADATQTFWLIPQMITDGVQLTISYTYGGNPYTWTIDFGELLSGAEWKAGQLRTYTIKINDVNLMITDDVTVAGSAADAYAGSYKDNVKITNTGNTDVFIRAAIVGQWLDYKNRPVFGFTDKVNKLYLVESWYEDQFVNKSRNHGEFEDLAGYDQDNPYNGWTLCEDGYYYYTTAVPPITDPENESAAQTTALFSKYTVKAVPSVEIAGEATDPTTMHFELEISTQAISAHNLEGKTYDWDEAWENATGTKPVKKTNQ